MSKRESRTPSSGTSRSSAMVFEPGHPMASGRSAARVQHAECDDRHRPPSFLCRRSMKHRRLGPWRASSDSCTNAPSVVPAARAISLPRRHPRLQFLEPVQDHFELSQSSPWLSQARGSSSLVSGCRTHRHHLSRSRGMSNGLRVTAGLRSMWLSQRAAVESRLQKATDHSP